MDLPELQDREALIHELRSLVRSVAKLDPTAEISPNARFMEELGIDSLDLSGILFAVMDQFHLDTRPDDLPPIASLLELTDFVQAQTHCPNTTQTKQFLAAPVKIGPEPIQTLPAPSLPKPSFLKRTKYTLQRSLPRAIANKFSYASGSQLLSLISKKQTQTQQQHLADLHILLDALSISDTPERNRQKTLSIASNQALMWRLGRLANLPPDEFARWVEIINFDAFEAAHRQGHGVVLLTSHLPLMMLTLLYLKRQGVHKLGIVGLAADHLQVMGLGSLKASLLSDESVWKHAQGTRFAAQLATGRQILEQGGVVLIAADGQMGGRLLNVPFLGRNRPFGIGFAELTLATKALAIPVFTELDLTGQVRIRFLNQLAPPTGTQPEQVKNLIHQYTPLLASAWARHPGNVNWHSLGKFARNYAP